MTSTVKIQTLNTQFSGNPTIDEKISGIQFSPTLTPGTLTNINVAKDATTNKVGDETSYTISFTVVTAVPAGGQVKFTFPAEAVYKAASTNIVCAESATSAVKTCTSVADANNNVSTLTITDACTTGCTSGTVLSYKITKLYNPGSTKPISTAFKANTQTSAGYLIDTGTAAITNGLTIVANSFNSVTVNSPSGTIIVGQITEYKFTVALKNPIPATGGKLLISFPAQIAVQSTGSCTAVISSTNHVCTKDHTANTVTVTFNSNAVGESSLVVTITNGVKNPTIAEQSSFITFTSSVTEGANTYQIDQDLASITVTPNAYGTLINTSVKRVDSPKINTVTNLDVKATSANPIIAGSIITLQIPTDQAALVSDINSLTFFRLDASNNVGAALTLINRSTAGGYVTVKITEWCSVGGSPCPADTENIRIRATGFKNPPSTLPPSNSFKIFVDSAAGLKIDSKESALFATPSIQAGPLASVTISRDTNVVGAAATYTIDFTTTNALTETNGIFLAFSPPSGLLYEGSSVSCSYNSAAVAPTTLCQVVTETSTYGNEVKTFRIPMSCSSTS